MMDAADFTTMAIRERPLLVRQCARRLWGDEDAADAAEDACQDALVKAWLARDRAPADATEQRMWLSVIARNTCMDRNRRATRLRGKMPNLYMLAPAAPDPAAIALLHIEVLAVDAAIGALRESDGEALALEAGGYSCREMAAYAGMTAAGIKSRVMHARERLRAGLAA